VRYIALVSTPPTSADYRALIESAPEAIIVHAAGKFLYLNEFAARRLGAPVDALVGAPILEFVHPDSLPVVTTRLRALESGKDPGPPVEIKFVSRDGTIIPAEVVSVPIEFQGHEAILGLIRDTTRRVEAERALRESEERFGNAFRYSPHGMAFASLDGRWLRANKSLCDILGYSEEELRGRTIQSVTNPEDVADDLEQMGKLVSGELSTYNRIKRYTRKDGREIWVAVAVSAVHDSAGAPLYFIGQIQDITVQRQMEAEAARAERLAGIADTTVAVAHEMNNVLTVLLMNAELLAGDATSSEIPEIAADILAASNRIAATIDRLRSATSATSVEYVGDRKMLDLSGGKPDGKGGK
jgi:PAS domain S-box-containing protein